MKVGNKYKVIIEKLTNNGQGLTHVDSFVVFVDNVCPQDVANIEIVKINKNYAIAKVVDIETPSPYRVEPFCPMQKICGSCQIQFIDYEYQLKIKQQIVEETINKIGEINIKIPDVIPSPQTKNYRHKIQYPISETKNSKRILAGYYKQETHEIVNIKYCPIQPEVCDKIIDFIRTKASEYKISGYIEKNHSGDLKHVVIRHSSYNNKNLVVLVVNSTKSFAKLKDFAKTIYKEFKEVCGVCANYNSKKTNVILGKRTECLCGEDYIKEKILDKTFIIGAETFFQVNPQSAENIFRYVKNYISKNFEKPIVLDAYAGISAFGICISDTAEKVVSIEENLKSVELAQKSIQINKINNLEIHGGDAGEFFSNEKRKFDVIILDPPRKGCSKQSLDESIRLCNDTIIYVSCNPATLARDLKYLKEKNCTIESIQPFDMFCHTYHIENVAIIKINNKKLLS